MIQKIRIAKREKSELERWLSDIDPNWKSKNLFRWQYGGDNQTALTPHDVYDLKDFKKQQEGPITMYQKKHDFLIEIIKEPFTNVLTNIIPNENKKEGIYDKKQKTQKVVMGINNLL